ncbi:MAG: thioredoxin domain-containing protein [Sphingomicrobium sp.]
MIKPAHIMVAAAAILASAGCNSEKKATGNVPESVPLTPVKPPANGDWSTVATQTTAGGYMMGNPEAKGKLVEIGALTCPHCREFDESGAAPLIEKYVKTGQVSWEFRPYLLSGLDVPANLIAGCNGASTFFPLMRALYKDQPVWLGKMQSAPPERLNQIQSLEPAQQFALLAQLTGLQDWAAIRGVPRAKSDACLKDQTRVDQLIQQTSDVQAQYSDFKGTPSFILNGELLNIPGSWAKLEPEIKKALQ